ncbi:hypothetical protein EGX52_03170 [Yersinia pseudotuberculosis]|nr:hypothetical protein EGX52_03170 [Yersinia pseudotuberculosis]
MPVSVVGVKISKTGNYTILFTVSLRDTSHTANCLCVGCLPATRRIRNIAIFSLAVTTINLAFTIISVAITTIKIAPVAS